MDMIEAWFMDAFFTWKGKSLVVKRQKLQESASGLKFSYHDLVTVMDFYSLENVVWVSPTAIS